MIVKLKAEWEDNLTWFGAHTLFVLAEAIALLTAFKSYKHDRSLILAVVLPFIAVMPWLTGIMAVRRYKRMAEPKIRGDVQRDVSYHLGNMVSLAYLLFIMCITVTT